MIILYRILTSYRQYKRTGHIINYENGSFFKKGKFYYTNLIPLSGHTLTNLGGLIA